MGSIGVVSQEIEDLLKSPVIKEAIVQNTEIKFILDINKYENQKEQVLELFKINESDLPQIFSINKAKREGRGAFKEVAIKLGRECTVYGIEVSKYAYALFTTEATEVDQIRNISKKKSISFKDAAFEWAETLPD